MRARDCIIAAALSGFATACGPARPATEPHRETASYAGVVDSAVPREEALRRFRSGLPEPRGLGEGAMATRDALVAEYVRAVETGDSARARDLVLTRAEFGWLYYPTAPQGLPPYDLSPSLFWFLTEGATAKGLRRLLDERGGRAFGYAGYRCDPAPSREGANTLWGPCLVQRVAATGDTVEERLFGLIVERGGRFKFVSLANAF
jgi:hypothetical protein